MNVHIKRFCLITTIFDNDRKLTKEIKSIRIKLFYKELYSGIYFELQIKIVKCLILLLQPKQNFTKHNLH